MKAWRATASASLLLAGVVHLIPVSGVLGADTLRSLYGIEADEPTTELLMQHRAVLFGLLGLFFTVAAFRAPLRPAAFVAGLVSVTSFLLLAAPAEGLSTEVTTVAAVDLAVLACLIVGVIASIHGGRQAT